MFTIDSDRSTQRRHKSAWQAKHKQRAADADIGVLRRDRDRMIRLQYVYGWYVMLELADVRRPRWSIKEGEVGPPGTPVGRGRGGVFSCCLVTVVGPVMPAR